MVFNERIKPLLVNRKETESPDFNRESWMYRANNELHSEFEPLEPDVNTLPAEHRQLLKAAEKYYTNTNDQFNLFKLKLKFGDIAGAQAILENYSGDNDNVDFHYYNPDNPDDINSVNLAQLKKAYMLKDLYSATKNIEDKKRAYSGFIEFAENQQAVKPLTATEASAVGYWQARSVAGDNNEKEIATQFSIGFYRQMAKNRSNVGDIWWEGIALRQIAKISKDPQNKEAGLAIARDLVAKYQKEGDWKKAALWARDLNDLDPSEENIHQMQDYWQKYIEEAESVGDVRAIGKAHWQLYKRLKKIEGSADEAETHRLAAIENYQKLLIQVKDTDNLEKIRECYWVFSELIK
ncbi:MAG TPA: hypothetical protein PLR18_03940 [bacterium]|nr:hypothetical protein [bacterium]